MPYNRQFPAAKVCTDCSSIEEGMAAAVTVAAVAAVSVAVSVAVAAPSVIFNRTAQIKIPLYLQINIITFLIKASFLLIKLMVQSRKQKYFI